MADFFTSRFLDECGLQEYSGIFKQCNINVEELPKITSTILLRLIPDADHRQLFKIKWEATFGSSIPEAPAVEVINVGPENIDPNSQQPTIYAIKDSLYNYVTRESLLAFLNSDPLGKNLLSKYAKKELGNKESNYVVRIIMRELLKINYDLWDNSHWEKASYSVAGSTGIFSEESPLTYYTPAPRRGGASGKFPNAYRNRRALVQSLEENKLSKKRQREEAVEVPDLKTQSDTIKASVKWMNENESPLEDVIKHFKITSNYRQKLIAANKGKDIQFIFDEFSILKNAEIGGQLIKVDFAERYGEFENTAVKFDLFWTAIRQTPCEKEDHRGTLEKLADLESSSEDTAVLAKLCLIPYYYPPKTSVYEEKEGVGVAEKEQKPKSGSKGKRNVALKKDCNRFSAAVAEKSVVQFVEDATDTVSVKEKVVEKHKKNPVQPYILATGMCVAYPKLFFAVVNDQVFKAESAIDAVDICFKCFHVFDLENPPASAHVWTLLEKGLYELPKKTHARATLAKPLQKVKRAKKARASTESQSSTSK